MLDIVLGVLLGAAAVPANLIVWLYYRARWWTTPLGKGMALTAASVALILDLVMVVRIYPAAVDVVRPLLTVLYLALTAGLWMKYRAFKGLERERRDHIANIVRAMPINPAGDSREDRT